MYGKSAPAPNLVIPRVSIESHAITRQCISSFVRHPTCMLLCPTTRYTWAARAMVGYARNQCHNCPARRRRREVRRHQPTSTQAHTAPPHRHTPDSVTPQYAVAVDPTRLVRHPQKQIQKPIYKLTCIYLSIYLSIYLYIKFSRLLFPSHFWRHWAVCYYDKYPKMQIWSISQSIARMSSKPLSFKVHGLLYHFLMFALKVLLGPCGYPFGSFQKNN
jgi:hypothetical protein